MYDQQVLTPIGLPGRRSASCAERFPAVPRVGITLIGKSRLGLPVSRSVNIRKSPYQGEPELAASTAGRC